MNVDIGAEAAQFPEKENINGIFVAVQLWRDECAPHHYFPFVANLLHTVIFNDELRFSIIRITFHGHQYRNTVHLVQDSQSRCETITQCMADWLGFVCLKAPELGLL
jgi:hypothetical protein